MEYRAILQKIASFAVSGCLLLNLTGCGNRSEPESNGDQTQSVESQVIQNTEPVESQANQEPNETVANSTGTVIVETEFYTVEIPQEWEEYCTYEAISTGAGEYLIFRIKDKYMEDYGDSTLLELAAVENPEFLNGERYSYVCRICEYRAELFDLMQWSPDNIQVKEQHQEFLMNLQEFVPYVVQSIKATDGYTLSYESMDYEPMMEDDGIPYVPNAWVDILGTEFVPPPICEPATGSNINLQFVNDLDDVSYYWTREDAVGPMEFYGVRNGLIVSYIEQFEDLRIEVRTLLSSEFDGIPPKIVSAQFLVNYYIWKVENGYFVCCAYRMGEGYLYDEVYSWAFYTDKELCSLLTEY